MGDHDQPVVSRGFRGRPPAEPERLPPGQYLTRDFPVLATGRRRSTRPTTGG